eukprot:TRINITY_DN21929_c0_g1_i1.p1 TRINITY_DN21929_c0_g1~~TRINITY_DN21929_c0_g1_i1.p1  ORF type:complete len:381 (+),score=65.05 TRINITY_DN21929_c0_g1_i1:90-1232(+)
MHGGYCLPSFGLDCLIGGQKQSKHRGASCSKGSRASDGARRLQLSSDSACGSDAADWACLGDMHGGGGEIRSPAVPCMAELNAKRPPSLHGIQGGRPQSLGESLGISRTASSQPYLGSTTDCLIGLSGEAARERDQLARCSPDNWQLRAIRTASAAARGARRSAVAARRAALAVGKHLVPPAAASSAGSLCGSSPKGKHKPPPLGDSIGIAEQGLRNDFMRPSHGGELEPGTPCSELPIEGVVIKQPEDGSCLFHSIAYGLKDGTSGEELRKQVAEVIEDEPSLKIANTSVGEWVTMSTGKSHSSHARELYRGDIWGGALELAVAAKIRGVNIHVFEQCAGGFHCITAFNEPTARHTVNVVYRTEPCRHYDALCLDTELK